MNINICLSPRISIFSFVLGEIYLFFSIFFFCEPNSAIRKVLVLFEFGFFCGGYASRLTQELRFDLFIRQFASVRANICSVVFVFL